MLKTIFVVDDNDINLSIAREALKGQYRVMTLPSALKMFQLLEKITPDLILLDIEMPEINGFEALRLLKSNDSQADIPVVFLTSMTDVTIEASGFEMGVVDFITKPFSAPVLINRLKAHLNIDEIIRERTLRLQRLQNGLIIVLADMVENRDDVTGGHIERTTIYIRLLMDELLKQGVYIEEICDIDFELFASSARLHDVGKISISDTILNKPGKLGDDEFAIMKTHAQKGEDIINKIVSRAEDDEAFLKNAKLFAGYHHERWDGKGYPYGLKESDTPIQGRIMSLVDVYDALVSERPYKKPFSHDDAISIIMENAGTQFDPKIANVFFNMKDQFAEIKID
jgi:putative two-component system response regulator